MYISTGPGMYLHNNESVIQGSGGYQALSQRHYENFSAKLDNFLTGGGRERIVYRQSNAVWWSYKGLYLLLFAARMAAWVWCVSRDIPMNREHWLGVLALAAVLPGLLTLYYLLSQLTTGPLMTPNRFSSASKKLRKWSFWDTLLLLAAGVMILAMTSEILCGSLLLLGAVCSGTLYVLERRRKCVVIEPKG